MNEMSLMEILKGSNSELAEKMKVLTSELKQDKQHLVKAADDYSSKYSEEIQEGTKKKQLLLSEGKGRGMSAEDAEKYAYKGGFLPTVQTPILNMLYFLLREADEIDRSFNVKRKEYEQKYGHLTENYEPTENVEEPPTMETFIYGNITMDAFNKLKKLKTLSHSPNEQEAFLAYRKCNELCRRYELDFDKIPYTHKHE